MVRLKSVRAARPEMSASRTVSVKKAVLLISSIGEMDAQIATGVQIVRGIALTPVLVGLAYFWSVFSID